MAEAEDVIVDVARHATEYAQALWRRRSQHSDDASLSLADVSPRLALLIRAATGLSLRLRSAQPPAPPTLLTRLFRRDDAPLAPTALPATDGASVWLPGALGGLSVETALAWYRAMALQQAMRVVRGSARLWPDLADPLVRDAYLLFEAAAADADLSRALPGAGQQVRLLREAMLSRRPPENRRSPQLAALEAVFRRECAATRGITTPSDSLARAVTLAAELRQGFPGKSFGSRPLCRDLWVGELRVPERSPTATMESADTSRQASSGRSARAPRRPQVRQADEREDSAKTGPWMVQTSQPQEKSEDPRGLQRPADRDADAAPDELADALSELPEARLIATANPAKEFLLTDDPPEVRAQPSGRSSRTTAGPFTYPEWDYRIGAYHESAAAVHVIPCEQGAVSWVNQTLDRHRTMLHQVRRQFELLRARRFRLRKQVDGDELDIEAYLESQSDFRAGLPLSQHLYQAERRLHRDLAITLLVDVSGSTDGWVVANRRIMDVEREALLLVCVALEGLLQPYAVQTFSGEGPRGVTMRTVKAFDESFTTTVARRVSSLEPEHYTRVGAAIRHATAGLMRQPAQHRLLLLLSDGKPNDVDEYSGRYGVEDFRQAVSEAKLQGASPFCLTIDRQAASYLPFVFGPGHYALLARPELLPVVLLDWVRRLVAK